MAMLGSPNNRRQALEGAWWKVQLHDSQLEIGSSSAGASPLFFSEHAMKKLHNRKTKVASYYFDLNLVGDYWGERSHPTPKAFPEPEL